MTPLDRAELVDNAAEQQYEIWLDGTRIGLATYLRHDDVLVLPHTETRPDFGGQGFASKLVEFALFDIRSRGLRVEPSCPFVADFIASRPEFEDLLAA